MSENTIKIRMATPDDAEKILAVYAPYIMETGITFEYEVPTVEAFRGRIENVLKKYPYLVAERNGEIIGYSYANPLGERAAFSRAAETVLYVKMDARGEKIGSRLYGTLESILKKQNVKMQQKNINQFLHLTQLTKKNKLPKEILLNILQN